MPLLGMHGIRILHSALGAAPSGFSAIYAIHPSRPCYNYYIYPVYTVHTYSSDPLLGIQQDGKSFSSVDNCLSIHAILTINTDTMNLSNVLRRGELISRSGITFVSFRAEICVEMNDNNCRLQILVSILLNAHTYTLQPLYTYSA